MLWGATLRVPALTHEVPRLGSTAARLKLKGIDGGPHKRWSMWFNSTQREEPYLGLTCSRNRWETSGLLRDVSTGAAWLSSARVVRCWVKSRNERNPRPQLPAEASKTCRGLWGDCRCQTGGGWGRRQVIMVLTSRATHVLQWAVQRASELAITSQSQKAALSADRRLQPASVKPESLVIGDQPRPGEYVPEPCTHRPSSHESWGYPKSPLKAPTVKPVIGTKS